MFTRYWIANNNVSYHSLIFLGKNFSQVVEISNVLYYTKMNDNPELTPTSAVRNAVSYVSKYFLLDANKKLMCAHHYAGGYNANGQYTGQLRQKGANYLAVEMGYSFSDIIHFFYDRPSTAEEYFNKEVAIGSVLIHQHNIICISSNARVHNMYCTSCGNTQSSPHVFVPDPIDGNMACYQCGYKVLLTLEMSKTHRKGEHI